MHRKSNISVRASRKKMNISLVIDSGRFGRHQFVNLVNSKGENIPLSLSLHGKDNALWKIEGRRRGDDAPAEAGPGWPRLRARSVGRGRREGRDSRQGERRVKGGWKRRMPVVPSPRYESANSPASRSHPRSLSRASPVHRLCCQCFSRTRLSTVFPVARLLRGERGVALRLRDAKGCRRCTSRRCCEKPVFRRVDRLFSIINRDSWEQRPPGHHRQSAFLAIFHARRGKCYSLPLPCRGKRSHRG